MRIFAGPWVKSILDRLGMKEGERIESRMVTRRIEAAQKKVEERNFEIRKNLLEYDEVMDEQRKRIYRYRQRILDGVSCRDLIVDMIRAQVDHTIGVFLDRDYGVDTFAKWASARLSTTLDPRDYRGLDFASAELHAKDQAERLAETQVLDAIEENLPIEEEASEWNWEALAKMADVRWGLSLRDRDLKKVGRDHVAELLIDKAREAVHRVDLSQGAPLFDEDFPLRSIVGWVKAKFGIELDMDPLRARAGGAEDASVPASGAEIRRKGGRVSGDGGTVPLHHRRRRADRSSGPGRLGPRPIRDRTVRRRFEEQTTGRDSRPVDQPQSRLPAARRRGTRRGQTENRRDLRGCRAFRHAGTSLWRQR